MKQQIRNGIVLSVALLVAFAAAAAADNMKVSAGNLFAATAAAATDVVKATPVNAVPYRAVFSADRLTYNARAPVGVTSAVSADTAIVDAGELSAKALSSKLSVSPATDALKSVKVNEVDTNHMLCKGDINRDGRINTFDIDPFVYNLQRHNWRTFWFMDVNNDGFVDNVDINAFVKILSGSEDPICAPRVCKGDMNLDGRINYGDIDPFVNNLNEHKLELHWFADVNNDRFVDNEDVNAFVEVLVGGKKPVCIPSIYPIPNE